MVDMTALSGLDTSEAKPPAELPEGVYPVTITGWKWGDCRWSADLTTISIETRPNGPPEEGSGSGDPITFDPTKRRIFKEFHCDPRKVDTFFYLNMFVDNVGVKRSGKRLGEILPELIGQETKLSLSKRSYVNKQTGETKEALDVKMVIDGKAITERRVD